ncbi:MAG: nucleotidyltransferase family protein [Anaeromyxobacteraceae bacterium]
MSGEERIAGIVLAAGASRRLGDGRNKLLLRAGGEPLVRRAARAALEAGLAPVVVVVGHEAPSVREALGGAGCDVIEFPGFEAGMGSSLAAGVRALPGGLAGVVVSLGDMPRAGADGVRAVLVARRATGAAAVGTRYGDVVAPPTFFEAALFPRLAALSGDAGPRALLAGPGLRVAWVSRPAGEAVDVDRPEDLGPAGVEVEA